jgi:endonuclease-8
MPEGDTLFRLAAKLAPTLEGARVISLELPRSDLPTWHLAGRSISTVTAQGKNLLVAFDEGSVLHVHLQMHGVVRLWLGEPSEVRTRRDVGAILAVSKDEQRWVTLVSRAPTVRLMRSRDLPTDKRLAGLGPDLLGATFDEAEALRRLRAPHRATLPLGVAVMDQTALAGIGNVYKSEILFLHGFDPFASVSRYTDEDIVALVGTARRLLLANVAQKPFAKDDPFFKAYAGRRVTRPLAEIGKGPLSVYGRLGHACFDCGAGILMERQGTQLRSTYYCPVCQPRRAE